MKILVAVKRVVDPYVKIRVKDDNLSVETQHVKMSINPFDEIAIEEALRIRESHVGAEIVLVSIGPDGNQETLRHGLALGADRAILVRTQQTYCSLNIAKILHKIVIMEQPALVLMGKQAIDGDNNQTPQMLAGLLNWPQAMFASKLLFTDNKLQVSREIDGGVETLEVALPAVVSTDLRLNEPRYASLPNIMKARQKTIVIKELDELNISLREHIQVLSVTPPETRCGGVRLGSVQELLYKLTHEAKVF